MTSAWPAGSKPADGADEHAAEDRPQGQAQAEHRAPDAQGPGALAPVGDRIRDDRQGHRVEHGAAHGLHDPEQHEPSQAGGDTAQQRAEGEQAEPELEDPAPAEPVRGRAGEHQQAGQDERVGVDGPLQAADRGVQVSLDRRQRDVHDGGVEAHDQQAQAADGQDEPSATPGRRASLRKYSCTHTTNIAI